MTFAYDIMWCIPTCLSLNLFVYAGLYSFEGNKYIAYGFDKYLGSIYKLNENQNCKGKQG